MPAAITDKFNQATNGTRPVPTTLTATRAIGASSITVGALTGWPTATAVHFSIYQVDTSGNKVAGSQTDWKGTASGTTISNLTLEAGSDSGDSVGAIVECGPTAAWANDVVDGILVEHDQDGTHGDINADSITATTGTFTNLTIAGTATPEGWSALGATPDTITALGNRSYSMVFNSTDLTDTLSPGMRLKMTRTVTAPTQCTDLEASSSQYYSRASAGVSGMTFTDDFVVSAWVKLESYAGTGMAVASRFNGTSGWELRIGSAGTSDGRVQLTGYNAAGGNYSTIVSYTSVPLGRWVHIAAQLDMSAFTATTTTSYVMIDGVDVPAVVSRAGTNPTALVQAGNLEIGSTNGGSQPFDGKIAQVAIYSAKVTQATILASINRTLTGSETSLAAAYSFNNEITDLTSNNNDLTAQAGAVATNADSPFALDAQGTPTGTTEYGIVTKTAFSTNTTITVQTPEGGAIPTTGGISAVSYSTQSNPYGFISQRGKWRVISVFKYLAQQTSPGTSTWQNPAGLYTSPIPIGSWYIGYRASMYGYKSGATNAFSMRITLSTANNTESNDRLTVYATSEATGQVVVGPPAFIQDAVDLSSATAYYGNVFTAIASSTTVGWAGDNSSTVIFADCAYI